MPWLDFLWPPETIAHIKEHFVSIDEVEYVVQNPEERDTSRSTGDPIVKGYTHTGKYIVVVYTMIDEITVLPITAYEPK